LAYFVASVACELGTIINCVSVWNAIWIDIWNGDIPCLFLKKQIFWRPWHQNSNCYSKVN